MSSLVLGSHFTHRVPEEVSGFDREVHGKLYLSGTGFVFQSQSKPVLWVKFLGLAVSLPFRAMINKVCQAVLHVFGRNIPNEGAYDLPHLFYLSGIAWKGVFGWKLTLAERALQFALQELGYHYASCEEAMEQSRSDRLTSGYYAAPCMHPLGGQDEYQQSALIYQNRHRIERELGDIRLEREYRQKANGSWTDWFSSMSMQRSERCQEMSDEMVEARYENLQRQIAHLSRLEGRVKRYADIAVVKQHGCLRAKAVANHALESTTDTITSALVEETARVDCCGQTCYREKRICCCVHKIDCCDAITCWAIDCICCMLCFSPATGDCCIVA